MQTHRLLTTSHQRRRLALWALTMLRWIAAVLFAGQRITARQLQARHRRISLDGLTQLVVELLIVRAGELAPRRGGRRLRFFLYGRDLKRRHFIRSLLGSRLRRVLKRKGLSARIDGLIRVLTHLDAYARIFAKRRGLTRLWGIKPAPTPAIALVCAPAPALTFADSS